MQAGGGRFRSSEEAIHYVEARLQRSELPITADLLAGLETAGVNATDPLFPRTVAALACAMRLNIRCVFVLFVCLFASFPLNKP